jgi:hypothetical protein
MESLTEINKLHSSNKKVADFLRLKQTKTYIASLSSSTGIPVDHLLVARKGRRATFEQGTWAHPLVAKEFSRWLEFAPSHQLPKLSSYENAISKRLANSLNAKREVKCAFGTVDILSGSEIIEVKDASKWKQAVGQVLVYALDYPNRSKRIHLFGLTGKTKSQDIVKACKKLGISVTFEC